MTEREPIYADLRTMYEVLDPPPEHLTDAMIAAVAAEDLDTDYALLSLLSRSTELAGTRGTGPMTVEFAYDEVSVLVRVSEGPTPETRRLDGWITPAHTGSVRLTQDDGDISGELNAGRFEFASVPAGLIRIWFEVADHDDLATPTFEI